MIWKETNLCKRWRSCSSRRKSAPVWCRAKILAALAITFVEECLRNKWLDKKNFLAMPIHSDMKAGGVSRGSMCRNYEGVGHSSVYLYFERLFRPALRGHGLSFQWDSGECSVFSR